MTVYRSTPALNKLKVRLHFLGHAHMKNVDFALKCHVDYFPVYIMKLDIILGDKMLLCLCWYTNCCREITILSLAIILYLFPESLLASMQTMCTVTRQLMIICAVGIKIYIMS